MKQHSPVRRMAGIRKAVLLSLAVIYLAGAAVTGYQGVNYFKGCVVERASMIGLGSLAWPILFPAAMLVPTKDAGSVDPCSATT